NSGEITSGRLALALRQRCSSIREERPAILASFSPGNRRLFPKRTRANRSPPSGNLSVGPCGGADGTVLHSLRRSVRREFIFLSRDILEIVLLRRHKTVLPRPWQMNFAN